VSGTRLLPDIISQLYKGNWLFCQDIGFTRTVHRFSCHKNRWTRYNNR